MSTTDVQSLCTLGSLLCTEVVQIQLPVLSLLPQPETDETTKMTSLFITTPQSPLVQGFFRPATAPKLHFSVASRLAPHAPLLPFSIRCKHIVKLQPKYRLFRVLASNSNPSGEKLEEKSDNDAGQGPPFLTILAGVLVFLLICWIGGSIILWLLGLFAKLFQ
ncbi:uncharacterized protein LOC110806998 [Carica papaya]|uniref:uncharacterized protein LOC110806998 n=1 Tax=Carica papaya TaxID=3649 RepID=UPI000B8C869F|nr:uncharacterized protein LOC110806998 [Carica papaya]